MNDSKPKEIKILCDQSDEIMQYYPLLNEFRAIKCAFAYPSGFGKTTLLTFLKNYHS